MKWEDPNKKVILWDIETTNLNADFGFMLCFGWKVLGEKDAHIISIRDFPRFKQNCTDDRELVKKAAEILTEADMWVTHYGVKFDQRYVNTRLLFHGLSPLPKTPHVDTWRISHDNLKLHSNRLASGVSFFDLPNKTALKPQEWIRAMSGHTPSIKYVEDHCEADVHALEKFYLKIRCLTSNHPNLALIPERPQTCPICGVHGKMTSRGWNLSRVSKSRRWQCQACGGWARGKQVRVEGVEIR